MKKSKTRFVVVYTPAYAATANKIIYDSSKEKNQFKNHREAVAWAEKQMDKDEDGHLEHLMVYPPITNEEILKYLDTVMPLATPKSSYYSDLGINARRYIEQLDKIVTDYRKKLKIINKFFKNGYK